MQNMVHISIPPFVPCSLIFPRLDFN